MMARVISTTMTATATVSNTPSVTVGPSVHVLAGSVGGAERNTKIKVNTYQLTLHLYTECLSGPTSSGNSAAVDTCQRFIATAIQADSADASGDVEPH